MRIFEDGEANLKHGLFEASVLAGVQAYEEYFGPSDNDIATMFSIEESTNELHDGLFPALVWPDKHVIFVNTRTLTSLHEDLSQNHEIDELDLAKLYISCGVITTLIAEQVSPRNQRAVVELYAIMSSPHSIFRKINSGLLRYGDSADSTLAEAIMSRDEEAICEINKLRLAIGILSHAEGSVTDDQDKKSRQDNFGERINTVFEVGLQEYLTQQTTYEETLRALGLTGHAAGVQFRAGILPLEIAGAFPMDELEIKRIVNIIQQ